MGTHATINPEEGLNRAFLQPSTIRHMRAHLLNVAHTLYFYNIKIIILLLLL